MGLLLVVVGFLLAFGTNNSVNGQTINGVCRANEYVCGQLRMNTALGADNFWTSIYGTGLPNGSGTYVRITYKVSHNSAVWDDFSEISASSPYQTWWYSSATQLNFYAYPQNQITGEPPSSFLIGAGTVKVCKPSLFLVCTNTVGVTWWN